MKGDLIKDKFYLKEYDEGNYPYDNHLPYNLNTFGRYLVKSDILTINDYFQDNNCGVFTIELKECYLVYLVSHLDELYFKHTKSWLSRIENENIDIIDGKNILKHFLYDSEYQLYKGIGGFLNLNGQFIIRKLYFPKSKFSRKECEYWSHICLRLYVTFLNITKKIFENNNMNRLNNVLINVVKHYISLVDGNSVTFFLEAAIDYKLKMKEITHEQIDLVNKGMEFYNKTIYDQRR